ARSPSSELAWPDPTGANGTSSRHTVHGTAVISMNSGAWNRNSMTLTSDEADISTLSTRPAGPPSIATQTVIPAKTQMVAAQARTKPARHNLRVASGDCR